MLVRPQHSVTVVLGMSFCKL